MVSGNDHDLGKEMASVLWKQSIDNQISFVQEVNWISRLKLRLFFAMRTNHIVEDYCNAKPAYMHIASTFNGVYPPPDSVQGPGAK